MKNQITTTMLEVYKERRDVSKTVGLSAFFITRPQDIVESEDVELDVVRHNEAIAPVLVDIASGAHTIDHDIYTNKKMKPPAYGQRRVFNAFDMFKVFPGQTSYEQVTAQAKLAQMLMDNWVTLKDTIVRGIELQASQVLQTGKIELNNGGSTPVYALDYKPKATHFPTVATAWSSGTSDKLADLDSLADEIRNDSGGDPEILIMGSEAWRNFYSDTKIRDLFKTSDGFNAGDIVPQQLQAGGLKYRGQISISSYRYTIYTYDAKYQTIASTLAGTKVYQRYLEANKVIMLTSVEELDLRKVFGGIPSLGIDMYPQLSQFVPDRVSVLGGVDYKPSLYPDSNGKALFIEVTSRPLCIPASIDRFGCLTTS